MLSAALLLFANTLLLSLRLSGGGSFPKPLTAAEEREWLEKYAQGDPEARQVLIERNLRLVAHIIKKYYTQSADQEDLISIGTIGLIKGISSFDPSKGARLATYAARCIENETLTRCPAGIVFVFSIVRRRKIDIAEEIDMYLLAVPNDIPDDRPQGQALLIRRHIVHGGGKRPEHIPQDLERLRLQVLFPQDLLQLLDILLDTLISLGPLVDAV